MEEIKLHWLKAFVEIKDSNEACKNYIQDVRVERKKITIFC